MPRRLSGLAFVALALAVPAQSVPGLKVPAGFVVTEFAGDDLTHDISTMTIDPHGRIVVAGRGYIKLLLDTNRDGQADRAIDVADSPKGYVMGLLWEGDNLYAVGDQGLNRFKVGPGDRVVGPSELVFKVKATGEHDAHAIKRGGDGRLYLLCGNSAGFAASYIHPTPTLLSFPRGRQRASIAGALLRLSPDYQHPQIVADGFRNPYDFDFGEDGYAFTYDSDNERCIGLPWYEGTRFYRVVEGGFYGWLNPQWMETWRLPPYSPDVIPPVADLGRGSPTGVACYRHRQFPERYRGGFFLGDWTMGRIWFVAVSRDGCADPGTHEAFLEASGDIGFAPTALCVHPESGDLYIAIGGRGTRGGVYRVRYPAGRANAAGFQTPPVPQLRPGPYGHAMPSSSPIAIAWSMQNRLGGLGSKASKGTAFEAYTRATGTGLEFTVAQQARKHLSTGDASLDREYSRVLAMMEDDDSTAFEVLVSKLTPRSDPVDDIYYLIVLARMKAKRTAADTARIANAIVGLDRKFIDRKLARDTNWPLRIAEVHVELAKKDPALNAAILAHPDFARPGNALLTRCPGFDRAAAAEKFLAASAAKDFAWNGELVKLLGHLPPKRYAPLVDSLWERGGLDSELLSLASKWPRPQDRGRFLDGLRSRQVEQIALCLTALEKLPPIREPDELLAAVRALRSLPDGKAEAPVGDRLAAYLRTATGQSFGSVRAAWTDWLTKTHPEQAAKLGGADGVDIAAWTKRLDGLQWTNGDAGRGKSVFAKASCAACHSGTSALGPDLRGVAARFGRDDLMTAILQPNKDVSPRYRATQVATKDGKVYHGLIVYEATDGLILQANPAATVRIDASRIESRATSDVSLMPAGLLDKLSDTDIADLTAYLKALR